MNKENPNIVHENNNRNEPVLEAETKIGDTLKSLINLYAEKKSLIQEGERRELEKKRQELETEKYHGEASVDCEKDIETEMGRIDEEIAHFDKDRIAPLDNKIEPLDRELNEFMGKFRLKHAVPEDEEGTDSYWRREETENFKLDKSFGRLTEDIQHYIADEYLGMKRGVEDNIEEIKNILAGYFSAEAVPEIKIEYEEYHYGELGEIYIHFGNYGKIFAHLDIDDGPDGNYYEFVDDPGEWKTIFMQMALKSGVEKIDEGEK